MIEFIILAALVAVYLLRRNYKYWESRNVPGPKPTYFVGNLGKAFLLKASVGQVYTSIYNKYKDEQFVGIYRGMAPVLLVRDPELVKEVLVKSFGNFHDNDITLDKKSNEMISRNAAFLKGQEWGQMRPKLTTPFSSGKAKWMYPLTEEVCSDLVKFITTCPEIAKGQPYEAKELCLKFTLNNIASAAFGLEGRCFEEENSEFRQIANGFLAPNGWTMFMFSMIIMVPSLSKVIPVRLVPKNIENRILNIVSQTLKYRKQNNIVRNDFLQTMSQLRDTAKDYDFTDFDITAQSAGFFGDGVETSANTMSWVLYNLASNPQVQAKLQQDVDAAFRANHGKLPYEALQAIPYLEAAVYETLRLYPALMAQQKVCTKSFTFTPNGTNKPMTIEEGTGIVIPTYGLHHDSQYWDDPEAFKPERVLAENKENLTKYTFLPFGDGPRACLGLRFGLLQVKAGVAHIIHNYELSVNEKTRRPFKFVSNHILMVPIGGLWLNFKKRVL